MKTLKLKQSYVAVALCYSCNVLAAPNDGQVISGAAVIQQQGALTHIEQASQNAIIHWQSFSINTGETTHFQMPSASSAVLNRVTGGNPSEIYGNLSSNGQVYLINPNGILVGNGAIINTAAFIASTRDVRDSEFLLGGTLNFFGDSLARITNLGSINATSGNVFLIAHNVNNQGSIKAVSGTVSLASATDLMLMPSANEKILIKPSALKDMGRVDNQGQIQAAQVELKAVGGNPYALAVNTGGNISAISIDNVGGKIILNAKSGTTQVSGTLNAKNGNTGGDIQVTGQHVALTEQANLDASGKQGGGNIAVGGGYQGKDTALQNAETLSVAKGAIIKADATESGNGGNIYLWSDKNTTYQGHLSAKGGASNGNGGFAEVSGKQSLNYRGTVDLSANNGKFGTLLLDPTDITINNAPSTGSTAVSGNTSVITATDLRNALNTANVVISTSSSGGGNGDITIVSDADASAYLFDVGNRSLTLNADRDININQSLRVFGFGVNASTTAELTLLAGRNMNVNSSTNFLWSNNLTLVADNKNGGTGNGTLTVANGPSLFGDNIRLFAPSSAQLSLATTASVSSNPDTIGKYFGDAGTTSAGIYFKQQSSSSGGGTPTPINPNVITPPQQCVVANGCIPIQIPSVTIDMGHVELVNLRLSVLGNGISLEEAVLASGDPQLLEWLKIWRHAQENLRDNPNDETSRKIAQKTEIEILKRLPSFDGDQAQRLRTASMYNDADINTWLDQIKRLEAVINKAGRDEKTLQAISELKRKVDIKLAGFVMANAISAVDGEGFQEIVGFSKNDIINTFDYIADPDFQKARNDLTFAGRMTSGNPDYVYKGSDSEIKELMFDEAMRKLTGMIGTLDRKNANQIERNQSLKAFLKKIDDQKISSGRSSSTERRVNLAMLWDSTTSYEADGALLAAIDKTSADISTFLQQRAVISQMIERLSLLRELIVK